MIKPENSDRAIGFLSLFFVLMLLFVLKPTFHLPTYSAPPLKKAFFIQIEGDIRTPGVYPFSHPVHIPDIINRAGGLNHSGAIPEAFNKITIESDKKVLIRKGGDEWRFSRDEISAFYRLTLGIPLSLNKESEAGLIAVPGIGPGLAGAIVRERTIRGGFKSLDEIKSVRGIGEKSFLKISPYLGL